MTNLDKECKEFREAISTAMSNLTEKSVSFEDFERIMDLALENFTRTNKILKEANELCRLYNKETYKLREENEILSERIEKAENLGYIF